MKVHSIVALEIRNDQTAGLSDVTHHLLADSSGISFSAERQDLAMVPLRLRLIPELFPRDTPVTREIRVDRFN